ncbi:MAG TPA: TRAP transporter small permease [Burkholderiaceae bacterium]|nr:TRAP transporter small permease [Burkholderiaceae bacterium]
MSPLHRLYQASGLLSAASLVAICGLILAQVIARNLGTTVRDADEFAAWAMAASGFLGLPYALHHGAHIRVGVAMRFLPVGARHAVEVLASAIALALSGYLAWWVTVFVLESWRFNEVSQGLVPVPMWIPQAPMVIGSVLLAVGFAERLVCVLRGRRFEIGEGEENYE